MEFSMQYFLDEQSNLQKKMPSSHPSDLYTDAFTVNTGGFYDVEPGDNQRKPLIEFLHWNVTALTDELHELLGEIGWKPWAKSRHVNLEAARGEAIDAFHFLLNIFLALGMTGEDIRAAYDAKHDKNAKRQEEGYDGVSTKCPGCKRALDDEAVKCFCHDTNLERLIFCEQTNTWYSVSLEDGLARRKKTEA